MGRMHSKGKGMSASAIPYRRGKASWCKSESQDVWDKICKLSKKGLTPSQIGVLLRDSDGIPQVRSVTGTKVLRILKGNGVCPTYARSPCPHRAARSRSCWTALRTPLPPPASRRPRRVLLAASPTPPHQTGGRRARNH